MIVFPNAKINIGLNIVAKRADGFHDLETIFYPIKLTDCLEFIVDGKEDSFSVSGIEIPNDGKKNLVIRALEILREDFEIPPLNIHLLKKIPFGAGLGGGSSDAAYMLIACNQYFNLNIPQDNLLKMASRLGSDCAFFIKNKPVFASGKGDVFTDLPSVCHDLNIVVVKPNFSISTPYAYSKVKPVVPSNDLVESFSKPPSFWKNTIKNDFEKFIFPDYPILGELKNRFYDCGAIYSSMTGSGSALFAIFEGEPMLDSTLQSIRVF